MDDVMNDFDSYTLPEYFCEGLARIEQVGPCRRLVFVIHQMMNGKKERLGVVKLVLPADALVEITQRFAADIHGPRPHPTHFGSALVN